ncbi:MAG TPA: helix-turn-helix domain-containing protein [Alloacidobacterium sp.]|nr:helix-turn-helix domain-containing protein [Alloacidobacterium sp.]
MPRPTPTPKHDILHLYSIGSKLKTLRNNKGLTLSRLSAETGLSTALLSKLETDRMLPTLQTLAKICRVYGVDFGHFFVGATHHSLAITRNAYVIAERREQPTARQTPLHAVTSGSKQLSKLIDIPVEATFQLAEGRARTQLTAYVLDGMLHMRVAGSDEVLHTGDCFVLDTDAAVTWSAPASRCRVLAVFAQ